jgi:sigma-B regulation protein RsbU (phosphoserine phosphatase)
MGIPEPSSDLSRLREEILRLRRSVEELSTLNELAHAIGASLDSQEIVRKIIRTSVRSVGGEQGVITLLDRVAPDLGVTLARTTIGENRHGQYHLGQNIVGWMQINKKPLLSNTLTSDARFSSEWRDSDVKSILCVPLMVRSELTGVLSIYNKNEARGFTEDDQRLLSIVAGQSAQIIENARLYESQQEMLRMREEMRVAAKIQKNLLPQASPEFIGYDIAGLNQPAQTVGGDYYDFIPIDAGRIGICLADVSGKGVPASLLMANIQATMRSQLLVDPQPAVTLTRANILLLKSTGPETFATMFFCVLDNSSHAITYASAGHDHPFHVRANAPIQRITEGGVPLGLFDNFQYSQHQVELGPGDIIVISSDGITEAFNEQGEMFGEEQVEEILLKDVSGSAEETLHRIFAAVKRFVGNTPQSDDMTLVVVKRI